MRRREFIAASIAALSPVARAQQQPIPVIGLLGSASPLQWNKRLRAYRQGLIEGGYTENKNVIIEYRWSDGHNDRLPSLVADLVRKKVQVIAVLGNTSSTLAAKAATSVIPIVFRVAVDPIEAGFAVSLSRPGGNLTGVTTLGVQLAAKQLELLHELVPGATIVGALINPANPILAKMQSRDLPAQARRIGLSIKVLAATSDRDLEVVFRELADSRIGGLVIGADAFFNSRNEKMAELAANHQIPTISPYSEFAEAGGLMSYGGNIADASRQAGVYTARILKGEKPADLPIQQVAKIELVINLRTARLLRLDVPNSIIARADEVIE